MIPANDSLTQGSSALCKTGFASENMHKHSALNRRSMVLCLKQLRMFASKAQEQRKLVEPKSGKSLKKSGDSQVLDINIFVLVFRNYSII